MTWENTTMDFGNATSNSMSILASIALGFAIAGFVLFVAYSPIFRMEWIRRTVYLASKSFRLFIVGTLALLPFALLGSLAYYLMNAEHETRVNLGKWVGGALIIYVGVVLWGTLAERVIKRLKARWNEGG